MYEAAEAAPVATTLRAPSGVVAAELVAWALECAPEVPLAAGGGALAKEMIRVNHYGSDATAEAVGAALAALGAALGESGADVDVEAARAAVAAVWR